VIRLASVASVSALVVMLMLLPSAGAIAVLFGFGLPHLPVLPAAPLTLVRGLSCAAGIICVGFQGQRTAD
jgi:hypothetical protein